MSGPHLVLGGAGFIGRHLTAALLREGHEVIIASRAPPNSTFPELTTGRCYWRSFEFATADWDSLVADVEVIHHYVWTSLPASANANALGDLNMNVASTISLLEAMRRRGGKRLVFSSSGGTVYGRLAQTPAPETHPHRPITSYGAGKAAVEIYLNLYRYLHGLDCRIARISNPYGLGQDINRRQGAVTTFLTLALAKKPIVIWGDGKIVRDYIHIADVVDALARLALAPNSDSDMTFNIGTGIGVTLNEIIGEIETLLEHPLEVRREPGRVFDVPVSVLDIAKARELLGWRPRISLHEGLRRTVADLRAQAPLSDLSLPETV